MALKLLQSGKFLARVFQNLQISQASSSVLAVNQNFNPVIQSRNFPGFFTKCNFFDLSCSSAIKI